MNINEYRQYETSVKEFMESEGIRNLTSGCSVCPECSDHPEMNTEGNYPECPKCGFEDIHEPWYSWSHCDCCGDPLAGMRVHASGYNETNDEIKEYVVCEDCIYYTEYGRLDDATMESMGL